MSVADGVLRVLDRYNYGRNQDIEEWLSYGLTSVVRRCHFCIALVAKRALHL